MGLKDSPWISEQSKPKATELHIDISGNLSLVHFMLSSQIQ